MKLHGQDEDVTYMAKTPCRRLKKTSCPNLSSHRSRISHSLDSSYHRLFDFVTTLMIHADMSGDARLGVNQDDSVFL